MWPRRLPASVREDPLREAEVRVFDALQAQLDESWHVFYSRPWTGLTASGAERDGECDFAVLHPKHGLLTIEVKGGGISFDPEENKWTSRDRYKVRHKIKNPADQALKAKYELVKRVEARNDWPVNRSFRYRHGVILPDAQSPPGNLAPDLPKILFACRPDMGTLEKWILSRLSSGNEGELGKDGLVAFQRMLAAPFTLRMPLGHVLNDDEARIEALTPQQFHILDSIAELPRVAVGGGAGTGKTIVAIEDALRLAAEGHRTLLTCLGEDLATSLRQRLNGTSVIVESFSGLCSMMARVAGLSNGIHSEDDGPQILLDSAIKEPALRFDAIIVDEGQDFRPHWWIALEGILTNAKTSRLHAFYDANQSVYGALKGDLASFEMLPIRLTRNLRNTKAIYRTVGGFYSGLPVTADGPEGVSVKWEVCTASETVDAVVQNIHHLCKKEAVKAEDIVVLSANVEMAASLTGLLRKECSQGLCISDIRRFKGLERQVAIVAATGEIAAEIELAYVALSRARAHLIVVGEERIVGWLQAGPVTTP
jgi:hypothetical protein